MTWQHCVVGNGPIGAAVALELSRHAEDVCLLGAGFGDGAVYSGHEDDSRMVRRFHGDPYWEDLVERNMAHLATLTDATGVDVFRPMPVLYRFDERAVPDSPLVRRREAEAGDIAPGFSHEDIQGGLVDPRHYVAVLNTAAAANGARVQRVVVDAIDRVRGGFAVSADGETVRAKSIVDARGCHQPNMPADGTATVGKVTVLTTRVGSRRRPYCFVDASVADDGLRDVYGFLDHGEADGRAISKFGCSERIPVRLEPDEVAAWFRGGYRRHPALPMLLNWIAEHDAGARVTAIKPCAFVVTPSGRPHVRCTRGLLSIIGCNGVGVRSCQALAEDAIALLESELARS